MALTDNEARELEKLLYLNDIEDSQDELLVFTKTTFKKFVPKEFHIKFYDILNRFAHKQIKNLITSMPPQHGKSEGATRRLMSFIAGLRPDMKMALICYAATKAEKFGREIMSIMREKEYRDIFPHVQYPERGYTGAKANTNTERESINSDGSMKFVGVLGPLTGDPVDILAMDDLYKDWKEANSPLVQENVWDWYISVADSRLHNDSQQLITFTRWSDNDLIAKLIKLGLVVLYDGSEDLDDVIANLRDDQFLMINFPALKVGEPNEIDPRKPGEALWPEKHSQSKLESTRAKDPDKFECLHQGNPVNKKGLMYRKFKTYKELPEFKIIKNRTDTADTGSDYLCSINYKVPLNSNDIHKYVTDVLFTNEPMEVTEPQTAVLLKRGNVNKSWVESNNGGRGFARNVKKLLKLMKGKTIVEWFHQGNNKEARIFAESASVNEQIVFPEDWHIRWPEFYQHITTYKKVFKENKFDDGPDVLTGIIEEESKTNTTHTTEVNANDLGLF
ncbi:phage terminase large subunit [Tenacibaculum maritimum]|nr:phage terminase large subunit [Tenacibaculum maritimum]MDB0602345.1 phage terminase large subunit [Tenacibaculum maritimum]MDB0613494.1 phage terminase large subunit [Tenacibaculum maritimum]